MTKNFIGYIGTYTKGDSEGIYSFTLDTEAEKITNIKLAAKLDNPTYLTISDNNKFLYSVIKEGTLGGVASYALNAETGMIDEALNKQLAEGSPPCHVSVDSKNNVLLSSNYHKGTVNSYLISQADGIIKPPSSIVEHHGSGPDHRQEKPHTHYAAFTPDEKFATVAELGSDKIYTYEVNNGTLKEGSRLSVQAGSGPRHMVFHPTKTIAYVMTEFSSEVIVLNYNTEDGSFTELQYIRAIPEDFTENNQGSAIHISSDGRFVYVGNRGHNSISVFKVREDSGELSLVEHTHTEGNWPRDFELDPTEKFIVASNQESGSIILFSRDKETGKLTLLQSDISVPDPVCIKFLHV
jgi:6-phosphogluconolactonase